MRRPFANAGLQHLAESFTRAFFLVWEFPKIGGGVPYFGVWILLFRVGSLIFGSPHITHILAVGIPAWAFCTVEHQGIMYVGIHV